MATFILGMATFILGMATFFLGLATFFLELATFFLETRKLENGHILVPHPPQIDHQVKNSRT